MARVLEVCYILRVLVMIGVPNWMDILIALQVIPI